MHIVKTVLVLMATAVPQAGLAQVVGNRAARPSEIDIRRNGDNTYQLILKSYRSNTVSAGQDELTVKVSELCAPRRASFGKYSFDMKESVDGGEDKPTVLVLRQDIECGVVPSAKPSNGAQSVPAPRMATPEQVRRVEQQTRLYFEAKDQGHYTGAYDLMAGSLKQSISFETWTGRAEAFNAKAGAVKRRTVSKITWYYNPPQVEPGLYAAVDFTSMFAEVDLHCGFLAWREQPDGQFVLVREEENYMDRQTQQTLKPGDLEKVRQQFNCR
ncbi:hypothetical protein RCH09_003501 [Actimicrobium sp. GrIS 1.19]|nr:hypothetical protein [Actimicrobium sp. GrIS 1.19]